MNADALAARYAALLAPGRVGEEDRSRPQPSEIEIQARWFDGAYGRDFRTAAGEPVGIVQFGIWNREAGPDFAEAAVRFGEEERRGAIELDTDPRDWEHHGHATNPDYENVILHVCLHQPTAEVFTRTPGHRLVPQIFLPETDPDAALAGEALAHPGRCNAPLAALDPARALEVLEGAARHRLARKSARLARLEAAHGRDEALYRGLAAALGYKNNKLPFTLLAQRLPLTLLQQDRPLALSLLFGLAGFLREPDLAKYPPDTRQHLRGLWENWWPRRAEYERLQIPASAWRLSGLRPINHPQRRLAALRHTLDHWPSLRKFARQPDPRAFTDFCATLRDPFWDFHYTLSSAPAPGRLALLGPARAADILANVLFPFALLEDSAHWIRFRQMPAELGNRRVSTAAARLFGPTKLAREATRKLMCQQGLLQIYEDFCLHDQSDCARCPFPEQLHKW